MTYRPNVCIISPGLPVPPSKGGAIETLIYEAAWAYEKCTAHIFSLNPSANATFSHGNVHCHQIKVSPLLLKIQRRLNNLARKGFFRMYDRLLLQKICDAIDFNPDIFHVHNTFYYVPYLKKRFPRAKILLHMHNDFLFENKRLYWKYKDILASVDKIAGVSSYIVNRIAQFDPDCAAKSEVVYNGISLEKFRALPDGSPEVTAKKIALGIRSADPVILFVGRLHPMKGPDVLLKAFKRLRQTHPSARLVVVGSSWFADSQTTPFLKYLYRLGSPLKRSVIFTGFVQQEGLNVLYNLADICVIPSVSAEPFALVNAEAMAAGCPLIASDCGGIPDIVKDGETGLLAPPGDADALCAKMGYLLAHPEERMRLAHNALEQVAERFDGRLASRRYEALYDDLMNGSGGDMIDICGVKIHNVTMSQAIRRIDELVSKRKPAYVVTPNVDHIIRWQKDAEFRQIYADADLVLADGFPLIWASHFLGRSLKEKVSGSDLVPAECPRARDKGYKLYFLGGRPGAAEEAKRKLEQEYPGIRIAGCYAPPYGFEKSAEENEKIRDLIRHAKPDILLVGLGSPKQEKWIRGHYRELGVPVSLGIGATLDFMGGTLRRAPLFMQRSGFEWLWRLLQEPGRLWKRYLVDDTQFFWLILKQKIAHLIGAEAGPLQNPEP